MSLPDRPIEVRRPRHPKARGVAKDLGTGAAGALLEEHELPTRVPGACGISRQTGPCTRHWQLRRRGCASRGFFCAIFLLRWLRPMRRSLKVRGRAGGCPLKCYLFPIADPSHSRIDFCPEIAVRFDGLSGQIRSAAVVIQGSVIRRCLPTDSRTNTATAATFQPRDGARTSPRTSL